MAANLIFLSTLPARGATAVGLSQTAFKKFLSTLPARGATRGGGLGRRIQQDFYPRSPRGERPSPLGLSLTPRGISIHAPREGSDDLSWVEESLYQKFLSTLPARGATAALLFIGQQLTDFYPRSPRGERRF